MISISSCLPLSTLPATDCIRPPSPFAESRPPAAVVMPAKSNGVASENHVHARWQALAAKKRARVEAQLPAAWRLSPHILGTVHGGMHSTANVIELETARNSGILSDDEFSLTENYSATALVAKLASRQVTSFEVTTAFCKRAAVGQQLVNHTRLVVAINGANI